LLNAGHAYPRSEFVGFKLTAIELTALLRAARRRRMTISDFVRSALAQAYGDQPSSGDAA
jgi:hypothetical protein